MSSGEWIGTLGVSILLIAFALNLLKKLQATSQLYLFLNMLGGALACISSLMIQFWPFVVLEGVWAISSLAMLLRLNSGK
jgi:hypothetical protein